MSDVPAGVQHPEGAVEKFAEALAFFDEAEHWLDRYHEIAHELRDLGYEIPILLGEYIGLDERVGTFSVTRQTLPVYFAHGPQATEPEQVPNKPRVKQRKTKRPTAKEIGEQFHWVCVYCQTLGTPEKGPDGRSWHVDHGYPQGLGGDDDFDNLILACATCNIRKNKKLIMDVLRSTLERLQCK